MQTPTSNTRPTTPNSAESCSKGQEGSEQAERKRSISLNEKLKRSQPIWYLPMLDRYSILNNLSNKQDGVSFPAS